MTDETEDFERMLEESLAARPVGRSVQLGEKVQGTVVAVTGDHVLVDLGGKTEGVLDHGDLLDDEGQLTVAVGDTVEAYVVHTGEEVRLSTTVRPGAGSEQVLAEAFAARIPVEGRIAAVNKGGFEVMVAGKRAFCPISQVDIGFVDDPETLIGEKLRFVITKYQERNIVLSRRALLEEERAAQATETWKTLAPGQVLEGEVTRVADFGAFVDLGGVDGLIHVSELSYDRVEDVSSMLQKGQRVRVQVVTVDREAGRVGLSLRALEADPWDEALDRYPPGSVHEGRVTRLQPFGAFVALGGGVEGLVHVSELADRRINHPRDVVAEGETVQVRILEVDPERKRISLSLRETPSAEDQVLPEPGMVVNATVDRIETYGLLVRFGGQRGLIPASELPQKGASVRVLRETYPEGTELRPVILEVDPETRRIRLSLTAAAEQAERAEVDAWREKGRPAGKGFGTLGDLLKDKLGK